MNGFLRPYINEFVFYLGNIRVYSTSRHEHYEHLRKVLKKLRKNKFYDNMSKCEFLYA